MLLEVEYKICYKIREEYLSILYNLGIQLFQVLKKGEKNCCNFAFYFTTQHLTELKQLWNNEDIWT